MESFFCITSLTLRYNGFGESYSSDLALQAPSLALFPPLQSLAPGPHHKHSPCVLVKHMLVSVGVWISLRWDCRIVGSSCAYFKNIARKSSGMATSATLLPTSRVGGFPFLPFPSNWLLANISDFGQFDGYRVEVTVVSFAFLWIFVGLSTSSLLSHLGFPFCELPIHILWPYFYYFLSFSCSFAIIPCIF